MTQLPTEFIQRLQTIIAPQKIEEVLQSFHIEKNIGIRCNSLKQNPDITIQQLNKLDIPLKKIPWNPHTYTIPGAYKSKLSHHDLTNLGYIAIQNLASMWAVLALKPQAHEDILDLTAAPGSKTALIAECMQNTGHISACEKSKNRFYKLNNYLKQLGVTNTKTYLKDSRLIWQHCSERFDRVLCDVPCSSESRFNINDPDSYQSWSLRKIKQLNHSQKGLLESAYRCLKPGGILVYSTCTFAPEENEAQIDKLLKKHPDCLEVLPTSCELENIQTGILHWQNKTYSPSLQHCLRILPTIDMAGFFICCLKKIR